MIVPVLSAAAYEGWDFLSAALMDIQDCAALSAGGEGETPLAPPYEAEWLAFS
jgi:hypothetical protein